MLECLGYGQNRGDWNVIRLERLDRLETGHRNADQLAVFVAGAGPNRYDLTFHGFFLDGVGDDDAASRPLILFDAANQNSVVQRPKFHEFPPNFV